jgi:phosphatidylserine/phosphatidylglycerophosphate/cardiolipin synthase-like enzyme
VSAFDDLKARYFVLPSSSGSIGNGDPGLPQYGGCEVIPHIGGAPYFRALKAAIDKPDVTYIYLAGWLFEPSFEIVPGKKLLDVLAAKSKAGVDVRVLGWVMAPEVLNSKDVTSGKVSLGGMDTTVNEPTMRFIQALRLAEPTMVPKALLNVLSHPAGAVHTKFALVGAPSGDVGFTGGIDAYHDRVKPIWHDVQAEVRGAATQPMYDWFRGMWNENLARPSIPLKAGSTSVQTRAPSAPALGARTVPAVLAGTKHVQSGRTVPRMNFSTIASIGGSIAGHDLPTNLPVAFAPNPTFEVKRLWQKAISAATTYVYLEDQSFCSDEVFDWLYDALKRNPGLKVIMLNGRQDPNNPNPQALLKLMRRSINDHLLKDLKQADIDARVGLFLTQSKTVHTKSTIVDDVWAMIGSANVMRRSLYTDFEHVVGFMDEAGTGVSAYRRALFNAHMGAPGVAGAAADVARWFALPYHKAAAPKPLSRLKLPFTDGYKLSPVEETMIDQLMDVDSRNAWGSGLASLAMSAAGAGS